jgi:hypothetical protein
MHGTDVPGIEDAWLKDVGNLVRIREISRLGAFIGFFACGDMPNYNILNCDSNYFIECMKIGAKICFIASDSGAIVYVR